MYKYFLSFSLSMLPPLSSSSILNAASASAWIISMGRWSELPPRPLTCMLNVAGPRDMAATARDGAMGLTKPAQLIANARTMMSERCVFVDPSSAESVNCNFVITCSFTCRRRGDDKALVGLSSSGARSAGAREGRGGPWGNGEGRRRGMDGWGAIGALERASYVCMYVWMDGAGWLAGVRVAQAGRQAVFPAGKPRTGSVVPVFSLIRFMRAAAEAQTDRPV